MRNIRLVFLVRNLQHTLALTLTLALDHYP
jgi:hypothetical protein